MLWLMKVDRTVFLPCNYNTILGYYWREYTGVIPDDAVEGGQAANGLPIYIGQVLYADKLIPAKIYSNDAKAYFAWNVEQSATLNVKILCSKYPERFNWVATRKNEIHLLTDQHVVSGGYEPGYIMYIGRAQYSGQTLVGKVRAPEKSTTNLGLFITNEGKQINLETFEILIYTPNLKEIEMKYCNKRVVVIKE